MHEGQEEALKSRKKVLYTLGELNVLIDDVVHPFFKENPGFILVDGILHGMLEKDPPVSFRKFVRHNLPKIMKELSRKRKRS